MKIIKSKYLKNQYGVPFIFQIEENPENYSKQFFNFNKEPFTQIMNSTGERFMPFNNLYKYAELKSNLAIENEGSSKKIIDDLLNKKNSPKDDKERMIVNLNAVYNYLNDTKPQITWRAIETIYNILETNIDMDRNKLDDFPRKDLGQVKKYKTPHPKFLEKALFNLIDFINSDELSNYSLAKAHAIHIYWIYYHFTYDFNGRMGRILAYWYLLLNIDKSWFFIAQSVSSSIALNRKKYIKLWDEIRKKDDSVKLIAILHDFVQFINQQYSLIILKITEFMAEESLNKRLLNLNETQMMILINLTAYNKWITLKEIDQLIDLGLSKAGIHKTVEQLVDLKLIFKKRQGRNNFYLVDNQRIGINDNDLKKNDLYWEKWAKMVWG